MMGELANIPTLDELIANPAKAAALTPEAAQTFLISLAAVQPLLIQIALKGSETPPSGPPDRWLTVAQACEIFGVQPRWLYRHKKHLPHSQPSRKVLVFPEEKLRKWFTSRKTG